MIERRGLLAMAIVRCPIHGIAYDEELEDCPECAKGSAPNREAGEAPPRGL